MKKIKLLALDLDGTTLNTKGEISKENQEAIIKAIDNGIIVVPASGRPADELPKDVLALPLRYTITKNGAIVYDVVNKQEIHHETIDPDLTYEILKFLETKHGFLNAEYDTTHYMSKHCFYEKRRENVYFENYPVEPIENLADYIKDNNIAIDKINLIALDDETIKDVMDYQKENINLNIMYVGYSCIDVNSRMTSKGLGLKILAEKLGITRENIAAIGDSDNDMIMLAYSKHSFAMENGSPFLKSIADTILPTNDENGVAKAIEQIIEYNKRCEE